jgi:hypothetical protein
LGDKPSPISLGNAPTLLSPGLQLVFLRARRTVSAEICVTMRRSFRASASICMVQQTRPAGGWLQQMATNCGSTSFSPSRSAIRSSVPDSLSRSPATTRVRAMWCGLPASRAAGWEASSRIRPALAKGFTSWVPSSAAQQAALRPPCSLVALEHHRRYYRYRLQTPSVRCVD